MNVTGLAQHILSLDPEKHPARLSFYHFLKNLCEAGDPVTHELLNSFYSRALGFTHWQDDKARLFEETRSALMSFADAHPAEAEAVMPDLLRAWAPTDIQVVRLESQASLVALLNRTLEAELAPPDRFRVFPEGTDRAVAIVLDQHKNLRATLYHPLAKILEGGLGPLCTDYTLHYGPDLLLEPGRLQQIDVGAHTAARFRFTSDGCRGVLLRGYTFQRYAAMTGGSLHRYPVLFYPLKRIEQFFINRKSDPMYIELTGILEKAAELLGQGHPEGVKFGSQALERGKLALEHIFPGDKLVRLLINNLEKTLALEAARRERAPSSFEEAESGPRADWAPGASAGAWATDARTGLAAPLGSDANESPGKASVPSWERPSWEKTKAPAKSPNNRSD